jgi:hypothetical protein
MLITTANVNNGVIELAVDARISKQSVPIRYRLMVAPFHTALNSIVPSSTRPYRIIERSFM